MNKDINLDAVVNYRAEYTAALRKAKQRPDGGLTALCPFHDDKTESFSVDCKTGKFKCFACGKEGNFLTFWAEIHKCSTRDAWAQVLEKYGVDTQKEEAPQSYTVQDYADAKRLSPAWLQSEWGLSQGKDKDGTPFVRIPYLNENGEQILARKRYNGKGLRFRWAQGAAGKLTLYGLQRLQRINETKTCVLVEGESDTQTLVSLGIDALGVPGASTFKPAWTQKLAGVENLYLHIEPDQGGKTFREGLCRGLFEGGFQGNVWEFSCSTQGAKDPSELLIKNGPDTAAKLVQALIREARPISLRAEAESIPDLIPDAPVKLKAPSGWKFSSEGIFQLDAQGAETAVCRTPIIITKRLRKLNGLGEEKVELAFRRDGEWRTIILPRSTALNNRGIIAVSDRGATVSSENAKNVVRFLQALEEENLGIIPTVESSDSLGWLPGDRFLPGCAPGVVLDMDGPKLQFAQGFTPEGSFDEWKREMKEQRQKSSRFRFILSAAFAAPLLDITKTRNFMIYNWGDSKDGKTATLNAALSVWGDPDVLMLNFNATQVALERMAALYKDLPLGIDERQLAGSRQESLEKLVYMLGSGKGRSRGSKEDGLRQTLTWRSVILATGEEPLVGEASMTGISSRMIEIDEGAFKGRQREAAAMYDVTRKHHGHAGIEFVRRLIAEGDGIVHQRFREATDFAEALCGEEYANASMLFALVATADMLVSEWIFGQTQADSLGDTLNMLQKIISSNRSNAAHDVNEEAIDFILDWLSVHERNFSTNEHVDSYGWYQETAGKVFINPTILRKMLSDAGYAPTKTLKYMAEKRLVYTESDRNGCKRYSVHVPWNGENPRMVIFKYKDAEVRNRENAKKSGKED